MKHDWENTRDEFNAMVVALFVIAIMVLIVIF